MQAHRFALRYPVCKSTSKNFWVLVLAGLVLYFLNEKKIPTISGASLVWAKEKYVHVTPLKPLWVSHRGTISSMWLLSLPPFSLYKATHQELRTNLHTPYNIDHNKVVKQHDVVTDAHLTCIETSLWWWYVLLVTSPLVQMLMCHQPPRPKSKLLLLFTIPLMPFHMCSVITKVLVKYFSSFIDAVYLCEQIPLWENPDPQNWLSWTFPMEMAVGGPVSWGWVAPIHVVRFRDSPQLA